MFIITLSIHVNSVDHDGVWIVDYCDRLRRSTTRARKTTLKACVLRLSFSVRKYYLFIARERFSATTNPGETVADRDNNNRRRIVRHAFFFPSFFFPFIFSSIRFLSPTFFVSVDFASDALSSNTPDSARNLTDPGTCVALRSVRDTGWCVCPAFPES